MRGMMMRTFNAGDDDAHRLSMERSYQMMPYEAKVAKFS